MTEIIDTTAFMDKKKKWNIFLPESIADAVDSAFAQHGDKSLHVAAAMAMWLKAKPDIRKLWLKSTATAIAQARFGDTVLGELDKMGVSPPAAASSPSESAAPDLEEEARKELARVQGHAGSHAIKPQPSRRRAAGH